MPDDFDAQLDEALKRERKIQESVQPSSGIWYYVYFKPDWRLEVYKSSDYGFIGHEDAWKRYIVPELVKHYKLTSAQARDLADAHQGMPRGRVDISASTGGFRIEGEEPGMWYLFHGSDSPIQRSEKKEMDALISQFNLIGLALRDKVQFKHKGHETMNAEDMETVQKILGPIPYKDKSQILKDRLKPAMMPSFEQQERNLRDNLTALGLEG
jgi:hypothetical protein